MLISVIVPIYNIDRYIDRCVQSIVNQTYRDLEIILVDDGSSDNSGIVCDAWEKKDKRIKVIHKINGGASDARNMGIKQSRGELLSFVDGDDELNETMYEKLINAMLRTQTDISMCRMEKIEKTRKYPTRQFLKESEEAMIFSGKEAMRYLLQDKIDCSPCLRVYKRKLWDELRFPIGNTNEDFAVLYKVFDAANSIVYIPEILYHYYYRENSVTSAEFSEKQFDKIDNSLEMVDYVRKNTPELMLEARYYLVLQSTYLLKKICLDKMEQLYEQRYHQTRSLIRKNSINIFRMTWMPLKNKLMCLCLAWMPKLYRKIHRGN